MRLNSYLSPKCEVRESGIAGKGVFAVETVSIEEVVAIWGGQIYTEDEVNRLATVFPHFATHPVSIAPGFYLGTEKLFALDSAEYFNHSCDPNVGVKGQIVLVARKQIETGQELTFDYDTTESFASPFTCSCGSHLCRKVIDGSAYRDDEFLSRNAEYLSWNIQELMRAEKRTPITI